MLNSTEEGSGNGAVHGSPHLPLLFGSFYRAIHVTCKQDSVRKLLHLFFMSGLLSESIETALCLLHICVSQSKFHITLTLALK